MAGRAGRWRGCATCARGALLVAGLGFGLLAGCGDSRSPELRADPPSSAPAVAPASAPAPAPSASAAGPSAKVRDEGSLAGWLGEPPGHFARLLADPARYRLEILVSAVDEEPTGRSLRSFGYRVDAEYEYPASAIKLLMAAAALRSLEELGQSSGKPLGIDTPLGLCVGAQTSCAVMRDPGNPDGGHITIAHEIRKMLLVSDNAAFGRLYDLVGHRALNERMGEWGLASVRLRHRMGGGEREGLSSPALDFLLPDGALSIPARQSDLRLAPTAATGLLVGRAHVDERGKLQGQPRDFADRNYASLADLQRVLVALVEPGLDRGPALGLSEEHRRFLLEVLGADPRTMANPRTAEERHAEARFRPLLAGLGRVLERGELDYLGKAGRAYGFVVENAYLRNRKTGRALFVTAAIYADTNDVVNDDDYDYDTVAEPFMRDLGELLARKLLGG